MYAQDYQPQDLSHADWQRMLDEERERKLYRALDECKSKGVSKEALITLCYECQARWLPG